MENKNNCLVLVQKRDDSRYNDFIGELYHFPRKYCTQFSSLPVKFVYYDPIKPKGGVYFGQGEVVEIFQDKQEPEYYFAKISSYKPFSKDVPFKNEEGISREAPETYNPQNAVRRMDSVRLREISLDGGINLYIESDAHLVQVLGEQLIGSEKVGILELIKNSIDAGASYCRVRIENIPGMGELFSKTSNWEYPNLPGPVIIIEDDGHGMSQETIEQGWLRPASTLKTRIKERLKRERDNAKRMGNLGAYDALIKELKRENGRIPLGEKGVGRFATHRLGRFLELRTKTSDLQYELVLKIDWDQFDKITNQPINLNSIGVSLFREPLSREYGSANSGTKLIIYGGKDGFGWTKKSIEELNISILKLNSPAFLRTKNNEKYPAFQAFLECPQLQEELKQNLEFTNIQPNFVFDVLVNEQGLADYELKFSHPRNKLPREIQEGKAFDLRMIDNDEPNYWSNMGGGKRDTTCGSFYMHLDVWYRTPEWVDSENFRAFTDYLDNYGGISVYRDGVQVLDSKLSSEYDWLGLAKKHIKQGFRISYREFIGSIEINQIDNYNLIDKTNREGFLENQASLDLSKLAAAAIEKILLPIFIRKRDEFSSLTKGLISNPKQLNEIAKESSKFLTNVINSDYPLQTDPYKFFDQLWEKVDERRAGLVNLSDSIKKLQKSIQILEDNQTLFVEQAGFGIAVAVSLHEINKITSHFYEGVAALLKSGDFNKIKLEDLKDTSLSLRSELKRLSPLRAIRNESSMKFDIAKSVYYASQIYSNRMEKEGVSFQIINPQESFFIYGKYATLNQVFGNLFDNSIYWIKYAGSSQRIIKILFDRVYRTVVFADSGSGISDIIRPSLFQPGYSLKTPPSGLGLFISRTYLNNMNAQIYETPLKDRISDLKGAQFTLDFHKTPDDYDGKK